MLDKLTTNILSIADLKALYVETFFNHTSKVSKTSDLSVLNAHAFAIAKLFQKDIKDTAIVESQIFPELSSGTYLEKAAKRITGEERFGASGSSTYVRVYADPNTVYVPGISSFVSSQGVVFNIIDIVTIDSNGYGYIPVRSASVGVNTNVDPLTINKIYNSPIGHIACTNEYQAMGGRDIESDEDFKTRVSTFHQFAAKWTHDNLLDNIRNLNSDILGIKRSGYTEDSKILISLITVNGKYFTSDELSFFESQLQNFMSLSDVNSQGDVLGIKLKNIDWFPVGGSGGIDFRVDIISNADPVKVRKDIQVQLTKYFDFRFWNKSKVEWDDMLQIVKSVQNVKYVPDEYFNPHTDSNIDGYKLPRIIKFIMRDMSGNILYNNNSDVLPIYYTI